MHMTVHHDITAERLGLGRSCTCLKLRSKHTFRNCGALAKKTQFWNYATLARKHNVLAKWLMFGSMVHLACLTQFWQGHCCAVHMIGCPLGVLCHTLMVDAFFFICTLFKHL